MSQPTAIVTDRHGSSSGFGGPKGGGARKAWEDCETTPLPPKNHMAWHARCGTLFKLACPTRLLAWIRACKEAGQICDRAEQELSGARDMQPPRPGETRAL